MSVVNSVYAPVLKQELEPEKLIHTFIMNLLEFFLCVLEPFPSCCPSERQYPFHYRFPFDDRSR